MTFWPRCSNSTFFSFKYLIILTNYVLVLIILCQYSLVCIVCLEHTVSNFILENFLQLLFCILVQFLVFSSLFVIFFSDYCYIKKLEQFLSFTLESFYFISFLTFKKIRLLFIFFSFVVALPVVFIHSCSSGFSLYKNLVT